MSASVPASVSSSVPASGMPSGMPSGKQFQLVERYEGEDFMNEE
jgi:hypothetical protein